MQTQIDRNNRATVFLLLMYPVIILVMVWAFIYVMDYFRVTCVYLSDVMINKTTSIADVCRDDVRSYGAHWAVVQFCFFKALLPTLIIVSLWFLFAYCFNVNIIRFVTRAKPLERKDNLRVYNIVENLCIAGDIEMPMINIVEDDGLNAYASGINISTFTITLTTGIIEKLDDAELTAVIAHELTHIKNRDTRLMVICIVFVGLISLLQSVFLGILKGMLRTNARSSRRNKKGGGGIIFILLFFALVGFIISTIAYFFSYLNRLAISRKREYVADAGAVELCGDSLALAGALRKISHEPGLTSVKRNDVAQLYIIHPDEEFSNPITGLIKKIDTIFCTHPETSERIQILEQF